MCEILFANELDLAIAKKGADRPDKIEKKLKDKGMTLIPLLLFLSDKGIAKLEIGIAKGKKLYDKRESLKQKDSKRDLDRYLKK
jgi:SsrA-binding protein